MIFTNEQGGTSQAMTLADTSNGTNTSVLWGVSVNDTSSSPTTGSSGWSQKIRVEGNGDLVHSGSHSASGSDDRLKKNKVGIIKVLNNIGLVYTLMERYDEAQDNLEKSLELQKADEMKWLELETVAYLYYSYKKLGKDYENDKGYRLSNKRS